MTKAFGLLVMLILLSACKSTGQNVFNARLSQVSGENVEAIQKAIAPFFHGAEIPLAYDVFTRSSELLIDKRTVLDRAGNVVNAKDISLPGDGSALGQRFFLKSESGTCFLLHEDSGVKIAISLQYCEAVPDGQGS
jgi:hypothetical protein